MNFNRLLKKILPIKSVEKIGGMKEYYFQFDKFKSPWGSQFNNQKLRTQIFESITDQILPDLIVETGTYRGTTTDYLSKKVNCQIYSVEFDVRSYSFSKCRFKGNSKVTVFNDDSRSFLRQLSKMDKWKNKTIFFYLDAHWNEDLPLVEELEIIGSSWSDSIVMIDDFKVPDDSGYNYDVYGGAALEIELLHPVSKYNFSYFFPISSKYESGGMRGSIILTNSDSRAKTLESINLLRKFNINQ